MRYVSIDIESTGLDPEHDQILEFGAVIDDLHSPIDALPRFRAVLDWDRVSGQPFALQMNARVLKEMCDLQKERSQGGKPKALVKPDSLGFAFRSFLEQNGYERGKGDRVDVVCAGKNFGGFDRLFLDGLRWQRWISPHRRVLDPTSMFATAQDDLPPSLDECLRRAGFDKTVDHTAIGDALDVIRCIRFKLLGEKP